MMLIAWPCCDLPPLHGFTAVKKPSTTKGNPTISGVSQISASKAGRWFIKAEAISLTSPEKIRLWRSIEGLAGGQAGQFVVPVIEHGRSPLNSNNLSTPHSDGTFFSDGTGYSSDNYSAKNATRVMPGETEITIDHSGFSRPLPGQLFSVGVRLYSVNRVSPATANSTIVSVWPTVRVEIPVGQDVRFDRPRILCRLKSDDEMEIGALLRNKAQSADLNFIEDTGPVNA